MPWPAVLAAGIAATNNLITDFANKKIENKRYQQQLADQQRLWHMNNEYNSVQAQMARLKSAGLNPNLVYQNGGATATSDQITPPNWQNTPLSDYSAIGQMALSNSSIEADARLKNAEAYDKEKHNQELDKFVGALNDMNEVKKSERDFYAQMYGLNPDLVGTLSVRGFQIASELRNVLQSNEVSGQERKNLEETLQILFNENDITYQQATMAFFATLMEGMNLVTEGKKQGYNWNPVVPNRGSDIRINDRVEGFNYVLESFIRQYKELHWQSSDAKHIIDSFNQSISSLGSFIPSLKRSSAFSKKPEGGIYKHYKK